MNWTGGRLRRHSNNSRSATLSKVQKQRFARSRAKPPKDVRDLPFQHFSQFGFRKDEPQGKGADQGHGEAHGSTQQSAATRANEHQSDCQAPGPTRLDHLKSQLLAKSDWAAVSASRPVQMAFTPIEEIERFGKRRRLTEADRNRLADSGRMLQAPGHATPRPGRREYTPEVGNIGIRINGVPARRYESIAPTMSPQSMLLDCESPCLESGAGVGQPQGNSRASSRLQLSTSVQPTSLLSMQSPSPSPDALPAFNPVDQDDPGKFIDSSPKRLFAELNKPLPESVSSYIPQPISQSMSPVKRRFTLDDQVLAEQEGMLNLSSVVPEHVSRQNERTPLLYMPDQSPTTQSVASNQHSPWLPQPKCNIQRFPGRGTGGPATFLAGFPRSHCRSPFLHARPDSIATTAEPYTSPAKLFGQSVAPG